MVTWINILLLLLILVITSGCIKKRKTNDFIPWNAPSGAPLNKSAAIQMHCYGRCNLPPKYISIGMFCNSSFNRHFFKKKNNPNHYY